MLRHFVLFRRKPRDGFRIFRIFRHDAYLLLDFDGLRVRTYISLRYSCTNWTAIAPSPTGEATRLTDPERTSPAANTPRRLVSRRKGVRARSQWGDCATAVPVR